MAYWIAGIDVHKKMLAVVIADVTGEGAYRFSRRKVGTSPRDLRELAAWFVEHAVDEVVMESTAQYWRPVWEVLERHWQPPRRAAAGAVYGVLGLRKPILNNRCSKFPIEPIETVLGTVRTKCGQMVRERFPGHSGR